MFGQNYVACAMLGLLLATHLVVDRDALASPSKLRRHVKRNLAASRRARAACRLSSPVSHTVPSLRLTGSGCSVGASRLPDGWLVAGTASGADVLIDLGERKLKRMVRRKAVRLRTRRGLSPWKKIAQIRKIVLSRIKHVGDDFAGKPIPYNRLNQRAKDEGRATTLGDYLAIGEGLCREIAILTQIALQDAGFKSKLVYGEILQNGRPLRDGHVWVQVTLAGRSYIVDNSLAEFNEIRTSVAVKEGIPGGWSLRPRKDLPFLTRRSSVQ